MAEALYAHYGARVSAPGSAWASTATAPTALRGTAIGSRCNMGEALVATVSLGAPLAGSCCGRGGGGPSRALSLSGWGDLIVMGGACQRTWRHSIPKCRGVGPRISVQFRHAYVR